MAKLSVGYLREETGRRVVMCLSYGIERKARPHCMHQRSNDLLKWAEDRMIGTSSLPSLCAVAALNKHARRSQ